MISLGRTVALKNVQKTVIDMEYVLMVNVIVNHPFLEKTAHFHHASTHAQDTESVIMESVIAMRTIMDQIVHCLLAIVIIMERVYKTNNAYVIKDFRAHIVKM